MQRVHFDDPSKNISIFQPAELYTLAEYKELFVVPQSTPIFINSKCVLCIIDRNNCILLTCEIERKSESNLTSYSYNVFNNRGNLVLNSSFKNQEMRVETSKQQGLGIIHKNIGSTAFKILSITSECYRAIQVANDRWNVDSNKQMRTAEIWRDSTGILGIKYFTKNITLEEKTLLVMTTILMFQYYNNYDENYEIMNPEGKSNNSVSIIALSIFVILILAGIGAWIYMVLFYKEIASRL